MSSSRSLCCLPLVKKQKHDFHFLVQCIIKQLLDSVFVIFRIIKVSVRVISLNLRPRLITATSTFSYSRIYDVRIAQFDLKIEKLSLIIWLAP